MKYRKKPVEVDAIQFWNKEGQRNISACLRFCGGKAELTEDFCEGNLGLVIPLLDNRKVSDGDWIIKDEYGAISHCPHIIFEKTYEKVEEWEQTMQQYLNETGKDRL